MRQSSKAEIYHYLDKATREFITKQTQKISTTQIAEECLVSRSLASQYLNELVADGLAVKLGSRPVLYVHKAALEQFLGTKIIEQSFPSFQSLLTKYNKINQQDFDHMLGSNGSLLHIIDQLKSAVLYPPYGLPVLIVGKHGTGKSLCARLMYEYGMREGILPKDAKYIEVDGSHYDDDSSTFVDDILGKNLDLGASSLSHEGFVVIKRFDHIDQASRELLLQKIRDTDTYLQKVHFVFMTSRDSSHLVVRENQHLIPMVVELPTLHVRPQDERIALALKFIESESVRIGQEISIQKGALRALINYPFDDNIDGLHTTITAACANAYLHSDKNNEELILRLYNLPSFLIGRIKSSNDDSDIISRAIQQTLDPMRSLIKLLRVLTDIAEDERSAVQQGELRELIQIVNERLSDYINFGMRDTLSMLHTYELMFSPVVSNLNKQFGADLNKKSLRMLAFAVYSQILGGQSLKLWLNQHVNAIKMLSQFLLQDKSLMKALLDNIESSFVNMFGIGMNELTRLLVTLELNRVLEDQSAIKNYVGLICCHGYTTATSMADVANRMLNAHVYDAIDMSYDQDITEIKEEIVDIFKRHGHSNKGLLLFDLGSFETLKEDLTGLINGDLLVADCVSTAMALELGSLLLDNSSSREMIETSQQIIPTVKVVKKEKLKDTIIFCSESGMKAAEKIRKLVESSLPTRVDINFLVAEYIQLAEPSYLEQLNGEYSIKCILGTMDPSTLGIPFVGLEEILSNGSSEILDNVLLKYLGSAGIESFHSNLVRNVTLRSVFESISILNPEMLYRETDRAVGKLSELLNLTIPSKKKIAIYVHTCGLIERLVTKNFVDTYPSLDDFVAKESDFIKNFNIAFSALSRQYQVSIPTSEIAYVYHMLQTEILEPNKNMHWELEDE